MNRERYLTVLLVACCIGATGVAATSLDATVEQRPDDVIDLDFDELPIGTDQGLELKGALEGEPSGTEPADAAPEASAEGGAEEASEASSASDGDAESDSGTNGETQSGSGEGGEQESGGEAGDGGQSGGSEEDGESATGQSKTEGGTDSGGELSLLERLVDLLGRLLPLVVLALLLALAYRYREHLLALYVLARGAVGAEDGGKRETEWPGREPRNEVHRAWLTMVSRTGIEDPHRRTTGECAAAAVDAGLDSDAVRTLTGVFEEVRYGERPVTDDRRERAREGLSQLERSERIDRLATRADGGERGR